MGSLHHWWQNLEFKIGEGRTFASPTAVPIVAEVASDQIRVIALNGLEVWDKEPTESEPLRLEWKDAAFITYESGEHSGIVGREEAIHYLLLPI